MFNSVNSKWYCKRCDRVFECGPTVERAGCEICNSKAELRSPGIVQKVVDSVKGRNKRGKRSYKGQQ